MIKIVARAGESGRFCEKPGESTASTITVSDPLENNNDVNELNAFVCQILITEITPHDGRGPEWTTVSICVRQARDSGHLQSIAHIYPCYQMNYLSLTELHCILFIPYINTSHT